MPQVRLASDEFFAKLTELLCTATSAHKGSIFLTQKPANAQRTPDATPSALLMRATNGSSKAQNRIKIATVVEPQDLEAFFARYAEVCKGNMASLKKRDRKKRKARKRKDAAAAAAAAPAAPAVVTA